MTMMANDLRDLIDEVETLTRSARTSLIGAKGDRAVDLERASDAAQADLDQVLARIDRARVDGVIP